MKILEITQKTSKGGKNYKTLKVEDEKKEIHIGSYWGEEELVIGQEYNFTAVQKGDFLNFNLGYAKTPQQYLREKESERPTQPAERILTLERIAKLEAQVKFIAKKLGLETPAPKTEIEQIVADLPPVGEIPF